MSLMLVAAQSDPPIVAAPPLAPEPDAHQERHSELLSRLGIHSWSIDLKTEAVRWERVSPTGAALVVRATLSDLLRQANDADSATFRGHLKEAIDVGHSGLSGSGSMTSTRAASRSNRSACCAGSTAIPW